MAVTPETIAVALGRTVSDTDPEWLQWEMWIADATMIIETRVAELGHTDPIDEAKLDYVIREAVVAQVRRPDAATQVTVSVNDASTSKTYARGSGRIGILDEWWALLGLTVSGAFSVDTVAAATRHSPYCSIMFGGASCSCGANLAGWPLWEVDS